MERCNSLTDWYNRKRPQAVTCAHPPSVLMSPAWLVLQTRPANAFQERQPEQLRARPASQLHSPSVTSGVSAEHEHTGEWWAGRLQCAGTDAPSSSHIFQSAVPTHTCSIRKKKKKKKEKEKKKTSSTAGNEMIWSEMLTDLHLSPSVREGTKTLCNQTAESHIRAPALMFVKHLTLACRRVKGSVHPKMSIQVKRSFIFPRNRSGASQQNSVEGFCQTTGDGGDLFWNVKKTTEKKVNGFIQCGVVQVARSLQYSL